MTDLAKVAEAVCKKLWPKKGDWPWGFVDEDGCPHDADAWARIEDSMSDAWLIVEAMRERGWRLCLQGIGTTSFAAGFESDEWPACSVSRDTAPAAILAAAAKALEVSGD